MNRHAEVRGPSSAKGARRNKHVIRADSAVVTAQFHPLKHDDLFGLFDVFGNLGALPNHPDGLFHDDTRQLSRWELRIDGQRPLLLDSAVLDDDLALAVDLTNPDLPRGRGALARNLIHLRRRSFVRQRTFYERLSVRNFDGKARTVRLRLLFDADFRDVFEIRGERRRARGSLTTEARGDQVVFRYCGLDGLARTTTVAFDPPPDRLSERSADWRLPIGAGERISLVLSATCGADVRPVTLTRTAGALQAARQDLARRAAPLLRIASGHEAFDQVVSRAAYDLAMLTSQTEDGPYPYGGIPWFSTVFGRDGLITALQLLWLDPGIARGVLQVLAATQADTYAPEADAEPGKILHELRRGEMARTGEVPFRRYYGAVDATPLFVLLAGRYLARTGDLETASALWPHVTAALRWMETDGDPDGDGFLEYQRRSKSGLDNQGWKDSSDSIFHADGRLAEGPIALCEVQAYAYAARLAATALARALGHADEAQRLEGQAERLREAFEQAFWIEELGTYALALDGDKRPCQVQASNAGHALLCAIAAPERARRVAEALMGACGFSGWGVRTLAASEARFNPMSYHNGSVWPHDNALIAIGMARYGLGAEAMRIQEAIFAAARYQPHSRLPELFCGFVRRQRRGPTAYPVACSPQAWAAAAPFGLLAATLGLEVTPGRVCLRRAALPSALEQLTISGLDTGRGAVSLELRREDGQIGVRVLDRDVGVQVETEP